MPNNSVWYAIEDSEAYSLAAYVSPVWIGLLTNDEALYRRGQVVAMAAGGSMTEMPYSAAGFAGATEYFRVPVYLSEGTAQLYVEPTFYYVRTISEPREPMVIHWRVHTETWAGGDATDGADTAMQGRLQGGFTLLRSAVVGTRLYQERDVWGMARWRLIRGAVAHTLGGVPSRQQVVSIEAYMDTSRWWKVFPSSVSVREVI